MLAAKPPPNRIGNKRKHNRDSPRLASKGTDHGVVTPKIASGRVLASSFANVLIAFPPSKLPKRILKRYKPRLCCQIASRRANQSAYQSLLGLLYAYARRPRRG
jgi:hypothetical protein